MNTLDPAPAHSRCFGDAEAFCALVRDHAGMVFATARRITGDAALAEDVAQETFLALARQRPATVESVGAWLHRVAWRKANNVVRGEARRRRHEECAVEMLETPSEAGWKELEPLIDQILEELPGHLREPLVEHFLEGITQQEIASRRGVSQATISRQLDAGISELRSRLRGRGVICGATLGVLLSTHSVEAAPASLTASLGKLALSGVGSNAPGAAATITSLFLAMNATKAALVIVAVTAVIGVPLLVHQYSAPPPVPQPAAAKPLPPPPWAPKPSAAQTSKSPSLAAPAKVYRPPPVPENVRFKVDAIIRRHRGMTKEELAQDPEFAELGKRFFAAFNTPEGEERLKKAMQHLEEAKGAKQGNVQFTLNEEGTMDEPLGRSWLEAAVSGDPQRAQDWLINRLEGATFEFTFDPTLETSIDGVRLAPETRNLTDHKGDDAAKANAGKP